MPITHNQMTFPDDIPAITVEGILIAESHFPRRKLRRFSPEQDVGFAGEFAKQHEANLDYSVDMSRVLEDGELVTGAAAWSNAPDELSVSGVRFAQRGALVYVHGGNEGQCYMVTVHVRTNRHRVFTYRLLFTIGCHDFDAPADYEPPNIYDGIEGFFFVDLLDAYVGPLTYDVADAPLFE